MSQIRIFDFGAKDLTTLLNEQDAGMLLPGVYVGYNLGKGAGNRELTITMDPDPNGGGGVLGVCHTRSGVTILEDADLPSINILAANTHDRIDAVVGVYFYNAGKPVNVMSYTVREGTPGVTSSAVLLDTFLVASMTFQTLSTSADFNTWSVRSLAATGLGLRIQVLGPDGEVAEDYDNQASVAAAMTAINAASKLVMVPAVGANPPTLPQTVLFTGGVSPVLPVLGPNDYFLGQVYVRRNAVSIAATDIQAAERVVGSFHRAQDREFVQDKVWARRPMKGLFLSPGMSPAQTSISAGAFIDNAGRLVEPPAGSGVFSTPAPIVSKCYLAVFYVGYRSYLADGVEQTVGPTYFTALGATVNYAPGGSDQIPDPTDATVLTAAITAHPRLTDLGFLYRLGHRVVATDADGAPVILPPVTEERAGERGIYRVGDGLTVRDDPSPYSGWAGLAQLIQDLLAVESAMPVLYSTIDLRFEQLSRRVRVELEGLFIADRTIQVPAAFELAGQATILPLVYRPLDASGFQLDYDGAHAPWTAAVIDVGPANNVPVGSQRIQVTINPYWRSGATLLERGLGRASGPSGLSVSFRATPWGSSVPVQPAARAVVTGDWTFMVIMTAAEQALFDPVGDAGFLVLRKPSTSISGLRLLSPSELVAEHTRALTMRDVQCDSIKLHDTHEGHISNVRCATWDSSKSSPPRGTIPEGSRYDRVLVSGDTCILGQGEWFATYEHVQFLSRTHAVRVLAAVSHLTFTRTGGQLYNEFLASHTEAATLLVGGVGDGSPGFPTIALTQPIIPFTLTLHSPGATPEYLTDDGLGNLRIPDANNAGAWAGTIDYSTGAYAITYSVAPSSAPTAEYAVVGAMVLHGAENTLTSCTGVVVIDTGSLLNSTSRGIGGVILRAGTQYNQVDQIIGTISNPGNLNNNNRVLGLNRVRAGTASYNGLGGVAIVFTHPFPSTDYRITITPKGDVSGGPLGDVWTPVADRTVNGFKVYNSGWDPASGTAPLTNPIPVTPIDFDWVASLIDDRDM